MLHKALRYLSIPVLGAAAVAQISFQGAATLATQGTRPSGIDALDFDDDGDNDLAVSTDQLDRVELLVNNGSGGFSAGQQIFLGNNVGSAGLVAADLDGDLDIDIAVTLHNANALRVLINNAGVFTAAQSLALGTIEPREVAAGDLDGDGDIDLVVSSRSSNNMRVLINDGSATFALGQLLATGLEPRHVALGDLNGDNRLDVAVAAHDSRAVNWFFNTGGGAFGAQQSVAVLGNEKPSGMLAADLDNDGDVDLVTTTDNNSVGIIVVLANNGASAFAQTSFLTNGLNPDDVTAADFDRDGRLDIATGDQDANLVSVLRNNGALSFGPAQTFAVGVNPSSIVAADLDNNGSADIATANEDGNNLSFLRNNAVGGPASFCTAGTSANGCVATISANANPRVDHATVCRITVSNVDGQRPGIIFYGLTSLIQPWCTNASGTSFLCIKSPTSRGVTQSTGGTAGLCNGSLTFDWSEFQLAHPFALGAPWNAGNRAFVQGWYRDPAACKTTQLSNAVELTYQP